MLRLHEKYKPKTLDEIVGQDVRYLKAILRRPRSCCVCLEGPTGVGKSATAAAFMAQMQQRAADAGYPFDNVCHVINGPDFNADTLKHYFGNETPFRFQLPEGVHYILLVEELEWMHPNTQRAAKDLLWREVNRRKLIVLATSNDLSRLEKALRHRFDPHLTFSAGREFALACMDRLGEIWDAETDGAVDMPIDWRTWGWDASDGNKEFSMRLAMARLEIALEIASLEAVA